MLGIIRSFEPRLVVLDTSTPSIYNDLHVAEEIRQIVPDAHIVLVGSHPSAVPDETFAASSSFNSIARGEYDYTLRDLAIAVRDGGSFEKIDGLSFRSNGQIKHNPARPLIRDLDALPWVSKVYKSQGIDVKDYYFAAADYPMLMLITGRGCPNRCIWCLYPQVMHGRKYRHRSPEDVVAELVYVQEEFPQVKEIVIEDDTFTASRRVVRETCQLMLDNKISLKWSTNVRADLDLETMKLMKAAGCRLLIAGFESGNQQILDNMHKGLKLDNSRRFVADSKRAGLLVHGCYMVGHPGETKETMQETLNFALQTRPDSAQFYPVFVYPGTEAYEWAQKNGYLQTTDYSKWLKEGGDHNCVISLPGGLTSEYLTNFCEQAYKRFHFNLRYLLYKIWQLFIRPSEGRRSLRSAIRYLRHMLKRRQDEC